MRDVILRKFIALAYCELKFFLLRIRIAWRAHEFMQLRSIVGRV